MYFHKVLGRKARSVKGRLMLRARAIAHDFLAYLADKQKFAEALDVVQVSGASQHLQQHPSGEAVLNRGTYSAAAGR